MTKCAKNGSKLDDGFTMSSLLISPKVYIQCQRNSGKIFYIHHMKIMIKRCFYKFKIKLKILHTCTYFYKDLSADILYPVVTINFNVIIRNIKSKCF